MTKVKVLTSGNIPGTPGAAIVPLEVDVSSEPVVSGPTTLSSTKEQRTFDFAAPQDEMVKPDNTIENGINSPRASLSENILLSSPFYNPSLSREVFSDFNTKDLPPLNLEDGATSILPSLEELPALPGTFDLPASPSIYPLITPEEERTFHFFSPERQMVEGLPELKEKGRSIEGLEKYEDMIKSIAGLPKNLQVQAIKKFSLLKYADYDAVKVFHKLIIENKDFFKDAPEELYDAIDPITMAYLNKSSKFEFNREKFLGSEITKLCKTPITQNLLKYVYLTRLTDQESSMSSIEKLIDGLEIVLKHDETNLVKTILTIATELSPIVVKFSQSKTTGYATMDGISITIGDNPSTIYESSESSNLDTLIHEYTHNVVGFLFDDKFDHRPYLLENPISKSQEDIEKAAKEDVSIKAHPHYGYLNEHYAREMIAYYVGETAGKIHQKQTEGTDTGFSVTQSELFSSWFKTYFLPVLNVYSKSGKAELSETLKCMFASGTVSEPSHLILDYLDFSDVEQSAGNITLLLLLEDTFDSGKGLTDGLLSNSSQLVLDYLGFSDVEPVGDITLVED